MGDKGGGTETGLRSDWAELTHECLLNILSRLTLDDQWRGTMLVCKSWLHASTDPSLHSVFDLETHFDSTTESPRWWTPDFERKIDAMLRLVVNWSDRGLTQIYVRHCSDLSLSFAAQRLIAALTVGGVHPATPSLTVVTLHRLIIQPYHINNQWLKFAARSLFLFLSQHSLLPLCPNLQVLSIKSCPNVTDESMAKIASACPNLRELDISYCYEISHESLSMLGSKCPKLRILKRNLMNWLDPSQHVGIVPNEYLDALPQDGDSEAAAIGKFMPQLQHLELRFSKLSAKGLALVSEGCQYLEYWDLSGCANVTSRDIVNATSNMKSLKNIKKPNFYIPRSVFHTERYGHWQLYDERFQTDIFRI